MSVSVVLEPLHHDSFFNCGEILNRFGYIFGSRDQYDNFLFGKMSDELIVADQKMIGRGVNLGILA